MTWASSTSWCGRTTSSPPCDATDDDGGNSSLAGEMARRGSENARGVLAARAVVERRCVTRASLCRLARVSRGAPRPPRKNSPAPRLSSRVARRGPVDRSVSSRRGQPDRARSPRPAVVSFARTDRNRRFGSQTSREFCGFERVELSPGIPTPINRRFTVRFSVERGFTILSTNEIARLRVFCFASRRFPMDT